MQKESNDQQPNFCWSLLLLCQYRYASCNRLATYSTAAAKVFRCKISEPCITISKASSKSAKTQLKARESNPNEDSSACGAISSTFKPGTRSAKYLESLFQSRFYIHIAPPLFIYCLVKFSSASSYDLEIFAPCRWQSKFLYEEKHKGHLV